MIIDDFFPGDINGEEEAEPKWLPLPLRVYFWVPFVIALALGAIGLEVALHFSHTRQGAFLRIVFAFFFWFG